MTGYEEKYFDVDHLIFFKFRAHEAYRYMCKWGRFFYDSMFVSCRNGIFHRDVKPENILIRVGLFLFRTDNMLINHFPAELFAKRI